jgi:hypothetical protein
VFHHVLTSNLRLFQDSRRLFHLGVHQAHYGIGNHCHRSCCNKDSERAEGAIGNPQRGKYSLTYVTLKPLTFSSDIFLLFESWLST